jgi:hypothetical protein
MTSLQGCVAMLAAVICPLVTVAQNDIENVRVETYYITDASDATDTIGGGLAAGCTTYRVYIDLAEGRSLRALYGRAGHPLHITSTAPIFNHLDRGKRFGHELNNSALDEGLVALDSWLSLGAASNQRSGIRKELDTDGSILGGSNNDGGSAELPEGLLNNTAAAIGLPLTQQDGLITTTGTIIPPNFLVTGDDPREAFADSTLTDRFHSEDFRMGCSTPGVPGVESQNELLVAQVTTCGELSFALNIELELSDGSVVRYVAADTLLEDDETVSGLLTYPQQCGCTDPNFFEFDPAAGCDDGSCSTAIVFGCSDPEACNYDPNANFNIPQLCCYGPSDCNGLDINLICPDVRIEEDEGRSRPIVAPNPIMNGRITFHGDAFRMDAFRLMDASGRTIRIENSSTDWTRWIDVNSLSAGTYVLEIIQGGEKLHQVVVLP